MSTNAHGVGSGSRYRELGRLGAGGMGSVALAEDTLLRRRVALKRVHTGADRREVARLRREALVGASLNHRNLVAVYDVYGEEDEDLVIVMEYVPGETLRQAIRGGGPIPPRRALDILLQLAAALDEIHARGVVHRDVKPANVLLGTGGEVKLADLGIAAAADRTQTTAGAGAAGTFSYMAPEQLEGQTSSATIDVYALAAVAFEMLCGQKARPEENPVALAHAISTQPPPDLRTRWPGAPEAAAAVLRQGMSADPSARPASAGALVARLSEALDPRPTEEDLSAVKPPERPRVARRLAGLADRPTPRPPSRPTARVPVRRTPPAQRRISERSSTREHGAVLAGAPEGPARRGAITPVAAARPASGASRGARVAAVLGFLLVAAVIAVVAGSGSGGAGHTSARAGEASTVKQATRPSSTSTGSTSSRAPAAAVAPPKPTSGASAAASPTAAVETFYAHAARHEYAAAWQLADANMRAQLAGFASFQAQQSAVRSITFHRAETLSGATSSSATVALRTTAVLTGRVEQCGGTARLVRDIAAGWLLDGISINCTP